MSPGRDYCITLVIVMVTFIHITCKECSIMLLNIYIRSVSIVSVIYIYIYIWSEIFGSPTVKKVKRNMADMGVLSYVGFSPPAQFLLYT